MKISIVIPVYNDWKSLRTLLNNIIHVEFIKHEHIEFEFIIVNDCSVIDPEPSLLKEIKNLKVLNLYRNVGHQRAIAIGLCYATDFFKGDAVIIMDSDGEDKPEDIALLIKKYQNVNTIVFAKRERRSEGFIFRLFYSIYKLGFRLLTNQTISFGNYCIIPTYQLNKIIHTAEIWNHFPAAIIRSKLLYETVSVNRGKRYYDQSKMNFASLIAHGFSALSVFADIIAARIILVTLFIFSINILLILIVLYGKLIIHLATPGWATSAILGLIIITMSAFSFSMIIGLLVLNARNQGLYLPSKNYKDFIRDIYEQ